MIAARWRLHDSVATCAVVIALGALGASAPLAGAAMPTDPQAAGQQPLQIMRVGEALDRAARPLEDVLVLAPDTGLDLDHPDLQGRLFSLPGAVPAPNPDGIANPPSVPAGAPGWDVIGTDAPGDLAPDADPSDPSSPPHSGHGTLVNGVLGAAWNNGQGGAGVAPNARLVALRTCWDDDQCYQYVQAAAIDWAADRGVRVVSMSWLSGALEAGFRSSIVNHPNVLFVAIPSGNGGAFDADPTDPQPCAIDAPNVLCVSTSSPTDGLDCGAYGARVVDVAVPTQNGVTTADGGGFAPTGCATSFAAPSAAGVATILFGLVPQATPTDVRAAIMDSARRVPEWSGRSVSGGIVDASAAVTLIQQRFGIVGPAPGPGPGPGPSPGPSPGPGGGGGGGSTAGAKRPSISRPRASAVTSGKARKGRASARVRATIAPNGAVTAWTIQRRAVKKAKSGKKTVRYVAVGRGTIAATKASEKVGATYAGKPGERLTVRVVATNRAGTTTSRTASIRLVASKRRA